jgi:hypothetical protein
MKPVCQVRVSRIDDCLLDCWGGSTSRDDVCNDQPDVMTSEFEISVLTPVKQAPQ